MPTRSLPIRSRPRALPLALVVVGLGLTAACVDGGGQPPGSTLPPVGPSTTTTTTEATTTTSGAPTTTGPTTTSEAPTTSTSEATTTTSGPATTTTGATPSTTAPAETTTTTGLAPSDEPRVAFVSPAGGSTVTSPVTIRLVAENFEIEAAGLARPGAGHFHLLVDTPCLPEGHEIPRDAAHVHLGNGQVETSLDLPAGPHTICLQAGDGLHRALPLTDSLSIVVAPTP